MPNFGISEPRRDFTPFIEPLAELRSGNIQDAGAIADFVVRDIFVLVLEVDHHVEEHHGHADIRFVLLEYFLGLVRSIKRFAIRIVAGTSVISAHDEVSGAVILTNNSVPDGLSRSA